MKMLQRFCVTLTVVLAGSALAFAQDAPPTAPGAGADQPATGQRGQRGQRGAAGQPGGPGAVRGQQPITLEAAVRMLTLTPEQQKQVDQVLASYRQDLQKFNTDNAADIRAARQAMQQARQGGDAAAVTAAQEKQKAIDAKRKVVEDSLRKQLAGGVLTREQMVKVERMAGPAGSFDRLVEATKKLELTPDQQGKLTGIVKTADSDAKLKTDDAEKVTVYQEATTKVMALLTDEQKTKLQQVQRKAQMADMFRGLNTTPEQDKKIQEILDAAAADAGNRQAMRDAMQKITDEVLTPEQRTQMQERMRGMRGGPGAGGPGAGGNAAPGGRGGRGGNAPTAPDAPPAQ